MAIEKRHEQIMQMMLQKQTVTVAELSERFSVSPVTIRSDLNQLAEKGKVVRTHGGARLGDERTRQEYSIKCPRSTTSLASTVDMCKMSLTDSQLTRITSTSYTGNANIRP